MTVVVKDHAHELLLQAIKAGNATKGTLQKYRKEKDDLVIIASEGFSDEFLAHFKIVKPFDASCCGRAFGMGSPVFINDVEEDLAFRPNLKIAKSAGFRAVKSVPIITTKSEKLGVLSIHFKKPTWHWESGKLNWVLFDLAKVLEKES